MYTQNEKIIPVYIEDEMKDSYISYAMSVIVGRALPDVRDGLKPVHRRILYSMKELQLDHSKPYKKSARIVGDCLGRFHPHGDTAVYDSLVRMAQGFSLRYPLVDGQGNWGSVDGDAAAAMRYTEARLASITETILRDLDKDTVDFTPNFDESLEEPIVLPSLLPNLLINGSSGIAVGMATNIPPHNLCEVVEAIKLLIKNPDVTIKELMKIIKGPDFPTGGIISGREGITNAYTSGKGIVRISSKTFIETQKNGKEFIIVTEIPYQVNKAALIEHIARLVQEKKIDGITDIRDESDKDGMRIVIEIRRGVPGQVILNQLYKHTQMQTSFGIIMLVLVNRRPMVLNLKELLEQYILHRKEIIVRRTAFALRKAEMRAHILEGLKIAIANLDAVIKTIRTSKSTAEAKESLIKKFILSAAQAQAILEMQLQRLTALERDKLDKEYLGLIKQIELYKSILGSEEKILGIIKEEIEGLTEKFGDERRTELVAEAADFEIEDLIAEEDMVITISYLGYMKRIPVSTYKKQRRGGKGITGAQTREEDFVEQLYIASTHDHILFFTTKGKVYWIKVHEIPQAGRTARGQAVVNLLKLSHGESIAASIPVRKFEDGKYVVMVTQNGIIKKTELSAFANARKNGIIAVSLGDDDNLIGVKFTNGKEEILLATRHGKSIRFKESGVRNMGRQAKGVKGITLVKKDKVIGMEILQKESTILTVTENGFGKRSDIAQYRTQSRGGKGIINIKNTARNGDTVGLKSVVDVDELMIITQGGMIVRLPIKDIRVTGRSTQGVRLISLKEKDKVTSVAKVAVN